MACCIYFFFICHSDYELLRKRDLIDLFFNACVDNPIEITLLVPLNFMGGVSETEMVVHLLGNLNTAKYSMCASQGYFMLCPNHGVYGALNIFLSFQNTFRQKSVGDFSPQRACGHR